MGLSRIFRDKFNDNVFAAFLVCYFKGLGVSHCTLFALMNLWRFSLKKTQNSRWGSEPLSDGFTGLRSRNCEGRFEKCMRTS